MLNRAWVAELSEEAKALWGVMRSIWAHQVLPFLMAIWMFVLLAAPIIIVIAILWYLDSIGFRAGNGFYTIGALEGRGALTWLT